MLKRLTYKVLGFLFPKPFDWWYFHVSSGHMIAYLIFAGPRVYVFRQRPGTRLKRWGGGVVGFEFGDRGGRKDYLNKWGRHVR